MKNKKRVLRITAILMLPVMIAVSILAGTFIKTSQPDNPLIEQTENADIEQNENTTFGLSEDFLSHINQPEITANDSTSSDNSDSASENMSSTEDSLSESKSSSDNSDASAILSENTIAPSFPGIQSNANYNNNNSSSYNVKEPPKTGESNKTNTQIPGDNRTPSKNDTDTVYFTTTINDGETVNSRDFSFKIFHKQKNLKVKSISIFVNGVKQIQFKGNVLLNEGENHIRVEATYTNENSKVISAYRDYKVYVSLGKIILNTDLTDKTVNTDTISFTASAVLDGENVPITVLCNNDEIIAANSNYTVSLNENENLIVITAQIGQSKTSKTFTVIYEPEKIFDIKTSLTDCTVHESSFSFTAQTQNGSDKTRLNIIFNGTDLKINSSGTYTVTLKNGSNKIRLKATDKVNGENITINKTFTIKFVPIADENTSPKINSINVTDGMTIKGNDFTLSINAADYLDNHIYYNGITVWLNGSQCPNTWENFEFTSYLLYLSGGENTLDIRITDSDGRYVDFSYKINCITIADGEPIGEITFSMDASVLGLGYIIEPVKITIRQGEAASYTIARYLEENGFSYDYGGTLKKGFYLSRLKKTGIGLGVSIPDDLKVAIDNDGLEWKEQHYDDSLGEFDYCQGSGWCYSLNGTFLDRSLSDTTLKDGDEIRYRFTLAYGKDIGYYQNPENHYDKIW